MMTDLTRTRTIRTAAFAATLSLLAGGALAQGAGTAATHLGYSAGLPFGQSHARQDGPVLGERPLTVMGMTGGIEPKYPETTGSIVSHPADRRLGQAR